MEAFVYLRVRPGRITDVRNQLAATTARRSVVVVGDWDVLCLLDGPDLATIASGVLSEIQVIEGVARTLTAPVVPPDRVGIVGFGGLPTPPIVPGGCYVHVQGGAGAAAGIYERLGEVGGIAGAAGLRGRRVLFRCLPG